jgi:hypothetical protein
MPILRELIILEGVKNISHHVFALAPGTHPSSHKLHRLRVLPPQRSDCVREKGGCASTTWPRTDPKSGERIEAGLVLIGGKASAALGSFSFFAVPEPCT